MGVITEENKYLLSPLSIEIEGESKILIKLKSYEHFDYAGAVLAEHFDIVSEDNIIDDVNENYVLYFDAQNINKLTSAIIEINAYHLEHNKIYGTH